MCLIISAKKVPVPVAGSSYVEKDLIPRLNGFELLMASYAMAHLKLDLLLTETGYKPTINQRFKVYLTNSLEESHPDTGTLFSNWLSTEANEANHIKRDTPVMCVIGNPPYSGESSNKGKWIMDLMEDYKKEPGGKEKLKERNPKWINDDYVKFIRYSQHYIEKNGTGILAFINPHGFLDNPTFRGMRWNLLKTYDKIYTIDLHGNSKKKETAPDGSADINVFDIQQGVSINVFVKTGKKKPDELGKVLHYDLYGKRDLKYDFLNENTLKTIPFVELPNKAPSYFMVQKDFDLEEKYGDFIDLKDLFIETCPGIVTGKDKNFINFNKEELIKNIENIYGQDFENKHLKNLSYRLFDNRFLYYDLNLIARGRYEVMKNIIEVENLAFITVNRQPLNNPTSYYFISKNIISNGFIRSDSVSIDSFNPLYLYPENNNQQTIDESVERKPNLKAEIVKLIADKLGLTFTNEKESTKDTFAPIDILDYIYAVLHSPTYREKYKEFLKIDFPRVPYPEDQNTFWKLVKLGGEIRQIHLLESATVEQYITQYPVAGDNLVCRKMSKNSPGYVPNNGTHGKVYINDEQYFDNVPLAAWEFFIGGYQPAQKWLKDRNGRNLEWEDIAHYQKIIVALIETDRIMKEIDGIKI